MGSSVAAWAEMATILCICPHCEEFFYVTQAGLRPAKKQPRSLIQSIEAERRKLDRAEELLDAAESELRRCAREKARRTAKKALRKIDRTFCPAGYDPQDVKLICHPVSYAIFRGLSDDKLNRVVLMSEKPYDKDTERVSRSIERTIAAGNIDFKVLRIGRSGELISA